MNTQDQHTVIDEQGNPIGGGPRGAQGFGGSFDAFRTVFQQRQRAAAGPQRIILGLVMMGLAFIAFGFLLFFGLLTIISGIVEAIASLFSSKETTPRPR